MKRLMFGFIAVCIMLLATCLTPSNVSANPHQSKFAVLISTGRTIIDDQLCHSEYWYDTVLTYKMLIENGFTHDHIYVLYGNGTDFASSHAEYQNPYSNPITDYAVTRTNIQNIFAWLASGNVVEGIPALTSNDFLFIWWMGHGDGDASCDTTFSVSTTDEDVTDTELAAWTGAISYQRRAFVFMTCHSGGAMDNLQNTTTVTMPSCTCIQLSHSGTYDVFHGEWTYWVDGALRELLPTGVTVNSDTDSNNLVSLQETFDWGSAQPMSSTPQLSDMGSIAPCTFIKLAEPGQGLEIYSRDHIHDDGTVPSSYEVWYHGPDLWVRNSEDGGTAHENPEYGQTNYAYANVHNIGCTNASNISVRFSWVEQSGWCNPLLWNDIDTVVIPSLSSLSSAQVHVVWDDVPLPGKYCLHTRLNVTGDLENADGRAYMDNNKVQINVDVVDNWAGVGWGDFFLIENGGNSCDVSIDLVFNTLNVPAGTKIVLELPPSLRFKDVKGSSIVLREDKWSVLEIPAGMKESVRVTVVGLNAGHKQRAMLTLTLPRDTKIGEEATVIFEEVVEGEVMGGIKFIHRVAEPETVMCNFLHTKANVFRGLAKVFGITKALEVAEISEGLVESGNCSNQEAFMEAMNEIAELEYLIGQTLRYKSTQYAPQYIKATEELLATMKAQPVLSSVAEAEYRVMLYASMILTDALTR